SANKEGFDFGVIDAHLHTGFETPEVRAEFFRQLKAAGVVGAVAHTGDNGQRDYDDLQTSGVIHCFGVGSKFTKAEHELLDRGLKSGKFSCIKIYLGYIPRYATDPVYKPAYELAEKYNVPVVFHTGDTLDRDGKVKFADPLTIDEVAVDHRKITFVIAHCGNPWIESAAEVAYKNQNVYLDGSAFLIGDLSKMPREKIEDYVVKPLRWVFGYVEDPTKLMFGSDWPLTSISQYLEAFKQAIPKEHWRAVFRENALRVFPKLQSVKLN
ncbi:amidohydrolase, partial [bacterium]|nr:amidohydrolase [bacterium]